MYEITSLYAGVLAFLFIILSARVILARNATGIALGADHPVLLRRVRVHGHFTEYVPLTLILMLLAESAGASALLLHVSGVLCVASRLLHAYAVDSETQKLKARIVAVAAAFTAIGILAIALFL